MGKGLWVGVTGRVDLKKNFNLKKERKKKKPFFSWSSEQAFQDLPQLGSESSWVWQGRYHYQFSDKLF